MGELVSPGSADMWAAVAALGSLLTSVLIAVADWLRRRREKQHSQLESVSAWLDQDPETGERRLALANAAPVPIYGVVLSAVLIQGAGAHRGEDLPEGGHMQRWVPTVPPGRWRVTPMMTLDSGMFRVPGIELGMTDAAGQHWIRRVDGETERVRTPLPTHYGMELPLQPSAIAPL